MGLGLQGFRGLRSCGQCRAEAQRLSDISMWSLLSAPQTRNRCTMLINTTVNSRQTHDETGIVNILFALIRKQA